jgi:hypothetical protein
MNIIAYFLSILILIFYEYSIAYLLPWQRTSIFVSDTYLIL